MMLNKPRTLNDDFRAARDRVDALNSELLQLTNAIRSAAVAEWAKTGCPKCTGRGWVVTWDTMDSMSGCYAEYGSCPNPECNAPETGPSPDGISKYDRLRGIKDTLQDLPAYKAVIVPMRARLTSLTQLMKAAERRCVVKKGSKVVAVKGRKVKPGTVGVVAYVHDNGGVLIKDESEWTDRKANGQWTNPDNLEVIAQAEVLSL